MRPDRKIFVRTVLISLGCFILGIIAYTKILGLLEPSIDGIEFVITGHLTDILFSSALGLIPALTVFTWWLSPIDSFSRKIFSIAIIVLAIAVAVIVRHQQVKMFFIRVVRPALLVNGKTHIIYPVDPRNFAYYLFGGLVVGCILSFILLRQKIIR